MTFERWREYYLLLGYGSIIATIKAAMHARLND
jgi:hypothetical protein